MMPTFLLWRTQDRPIHRSQLDQTATRLTGYFSPLLAEVPQTTVRQNGSVNLIALTTPVREWKRSFFEEDAETWVQAIDYPMDALSLLECRGVPFDHDHFLLTLCRGLETDPRSYLREMSPPFSLVWTN